MAIILTHSALTNGQQAGHSVLMHVTQFLPYFYIPVPRGFTNDDVDAFRDHLDVRFRCVPCCSIASSYYFQAATEGVRSVELVQKRSLWGYKGDDLVLFAKITVTDPKSLPRVRDKS